MREASADNARSVKDAGEWGAHYDTGSSIRARRLSNGKVLRRSARAYARAAGTAGDAGTSEGPSSLGSETHMHTRARSWPVYVPMCPSCPRRPAKCRGGHHPPHHPLPTSHAPALPRTPSLDAPTGLPNTHLWPVPTLHPPPGRLPAPPTLAHPFASRTSACSATQTSSVSVHTRCGVLTHRPRTPAEPAYASFACARVYAAAFSSSSSRRLVSYAAASSSSQPLVSRACGGGDVTRTPRMSIALQVP